MSAADWEATNQAYLRRGLAWLRDRLTGMASGAGTAGGAVGGTAARADGATGEPWWADPEWQALDRRPALETLGDLFGLSRFERLVLLLCAALELDPTLGGAPTLGLALSALPDPAWDAVAASGPLRYWGLIEIHPRPDQALISAPVRADERVVDYIRGLNAADARLEHLCSSLPPQLGDPLPPSQEATVGEAVSVWVGSEGGSPAPILNLVGPDPVVRAGLAAEVAGRVGCTCCELAPERLLREPDPAGLLRLWRRETILRRVALFVDPGELRAEDAPRLASLLVDAGPAVIVGSREPWPVPRRPVYVVDAGRPTADEQETVWAAALGDRDPAGTIHATAGPDRRGGARPGSRPLRPARPEPGHDPHGGAAGGSQRRSRRAVAGLPGLHPAPAGGPRHASVHARHVGRPGAARA